MSRSLYDAAMQVTAGVDGVLLRPPEKLVYTILADHWNEERGYAFPGVKRVAERAGIQQRSCQRIIGRLVAKGLVTKTPSFDAVYGQRSNHYQVIVPGFEGATPVSPPDDPVVIPRMTVLSSGGRQYGRGAGDSSDMGPATAASPKPEEEPKEEPESERKEKHAAQAPMPTAPRLGPVNPGQRELLRQEYDQLKRRLAERLDGVNEQRGLRLAIRQLGAFDEWLARRQGPHLELE